MPIHEPYIYTYIGARIRERRIERGLSQASLGEAVGLLRTSITNIESGRQRVPIHVLYQLCEVLDLEIGAVLPPIQSGEPAPTIPVTIGGKTTEVPPKTAAFVQQVLAEEESSND